MLRVQKYLLITGLLVLTACGGGSEGEPQGSSTTDGNGDSTFANSEAFFDARVAPLMSFCRTCHIPNGVADTEEGKRFLLSSNSGDDYANLQAAWQALGEGVESNMLIVENADASEPHSGGKNWPVGSDAYNDMVTLLTCWDDPANCVLSAAGGIAEQFPLLGSRHGGHLWNQFCEGQPDDTVLPPDPRSLVQPGVSDGKAVYFNAYWKFCHEDAPASDQDPTTCGEFRERAERGGILIKGNGAVGAGIAVGGNSPSGLLAQVMPATMYNNLWQVWGLAERPDNFDQLAAERYGSALSAVRNPYPLPGEDPNTTDGGSGQLPMAFSQVREADGRWTGRLSILSCSSCHAGKIGSQDDGPGLGALYGTNGQSDIGVILRDIGGGAGSLLPFMLNKTRGTGNITNFQLFGALSAADPATLPFYLNPLFQTSSTSGTEDIPNWWNLGSRPLKFFDGGQPADAQRIELSTFQPLATLPPTDYEQQKAWIEAHDQDSSAWLISLESPTWPETTMGAIDTALAEQGAVLFHSKDLWAANLNNPVPRPEGNGSCAGCHGAYSPRYVNDPNYLVTPELEGIAGYIVPPSIIGTDRARLDANSQAVSEQFDSSFYGYSEIPEAQCGDQNRDSTRGDRENGYLAPPLYGVWASAPYFHNGSVPNLWEVLQPADRKPIWRRVSTPARVDQAGQVVMGFDNNLQRAYDAEKLGWKYDELDCGGSSPASVLACLPGIASVDPVLQSILSQVWANGGLAWNLVNVPLFTNAQIEDRKIYNTGMYSQGNQGHEFTSVLNDAERRALIEYLKTL